MEFGLISCQQFIKKKHSNHLVNKTHIRKEMFNDCLLFIFRLNNRFLFAVKTFWHARMNTPFDRAASEQNKTFIFIELAGIAVVYQKPERFSE